MGKKKEVYKRFHVKEKEGDMVPLSDLIQIGSLIVAIIGLVYQWKKIKKNNRHY